METGADAGREKELDLFRAALGDGCRDLETSGGIPGGGAGMPATGVLVPSANAGAGEAPLLRCPSEGCLDGDRECAVPTFGSAEDDLFLCRGVSIDCFISSSVICWMVRTDVVESSSIAHEDSAVGGLDSGGAGVGRSASASSH